jgi:hypothetical protein
MRQQADMWHQACLLIVALWTQGLLQQPLPQQPELQPYLIQRPENSQRAKDFMVNYVNVTKTKEKVREGGFLGMK